MSTSAEDTINAVRSIFIIAVGALVIIGTLVLVAVIGSYRERALRDEVQKQADRVRVLKDEMAGKHSKPKFQTLEDLMKPYKKHLLQSAFDLQSRLNGQLSTTFLWEFKNRSVRDHSYAIDSTTYFIAEFFGWLEVIRRQIVFITGSEYAESLNSLLDSIRFQLTGETPIQGCRKGCAANDDTYDQNSGILQLYIVDIRSIGNAMLHTVDNLWRPITVDTFLQCMNSDDPQHRSFKVILHPLRRSVEALSELDPKTAPVRRIAIFQVLLCKLIDILDNAVPWDMGPKFDSNQEPRYIQRDMRMTPAIRFLSNLQKSHLQSMPFFDDDPNLSFPGFREDMKDKTQDFRDEKLWPGACPPREPRQRDEFYVLPDQYARFGARAVSVWPTGLRRRAKRPDPKAPSIPQALRSPSARRMTREYNRSEIALQQPPEVASGQPMIGLTAAASWRMARRASMQAAREGQALGVGPSPLGHSGSLALGHSGSIGVRSGQGLVVSVPMPPLPGAVSSREDHRSRPAAAATAGPGPGSGPGGGLSEGSESREVLTRAELPTSPGSSRSSKDGLTAGPGRTLPSEHLLQTVEAQHRGQTS